MRAAGRFGWLARAVTDSEHLAGLVSTRQCSWEPEAGQHAVVEPRQGAGIVLLAFASLGHALEPRLLDDVTRSSALPAK